MDPNCEKEEESCSSGNFNVMMDLKKEEALCGTRRWKGLLEIYVLRASFKMGGSKTQPYFLENFELK